ncbi:AbrB/MazE/SpoVT family DNA-binding domain-containing protein [Paenibacillus lautus]|uniref:AbrB/MazE/SpoVT family DNA-binding domain-containing protein n=1 Tax=Paenibacillus lautus TaxID=1401 RepID=UPI003D2C9651
MLDVQQIQFTIPVQLRDEVGIMPGITEFEYSEDSSRDYKRFNINLEPVQKSLFGGKKSREVYKVSQKGQITIPKSILDALGIQNKQELEIEFDNGYLSLIRGHYFRFKDIIMSRRSTFFTDNNTDTLTVLVHEYPDDGDERSLRVDSETFNKLRHLYQKIKRKYEPNSPNEWVGVPESPEEGFKDKGISIMYDRTTKPATLTIQKLGYEFLPEPLSDLWKQRTAFTLNGKRLSYIHEGRPTEEQISISSRKIAAIFQRNGRSFGDYHSPEGCPLTTVQLYTDDLVTIELRESVIVKYMPVNKPYSNRK